MTTVETAAFDAASVLQGIAGPYQWLPWERERGVRIAIAAQQSKLHSSIMLRGSRGLGKRKFAEKLAVFLLCETSVEKKDVAASGGLFDEDALAENAVDERSAEDFSCGTCPSCQLLLASTHPDIYLLSPDEGKKQISVEAVRACKENLLKTPHVSACKVCVIDPVEALNDSAANALLKLLEEPPEGTYFVLIADQYSQVLPTIRSRCQTESFGIPEQAQSVRFLAVHYELEESAVSALWAKHRGFVGDVIADIEGRVVANDFERQYFGFLQGKVARADLLKLITKETVYEFADEIARALVKVAGSRVDVSEAMPIRVRAEVAIELYRSALAFKENLNTNPNLTAAVNAFLLDSRSKFDVRSIA